MNSMNNLSGGKMKDLTMDDVKRNNRDAGQFFFSPDTMEFFKSRTESKLLKQRYFVTSECAGDDHPRLYTIREINHGGREINTVGEFQGYKTEEEALEEIEEFDN